MSEQEMQWFVDSGWKENGEWGGVMYCHCDNLEFSRVGGNPGRVFAFCMY